MNEKAKRYLEICAEAEDDGTSEGVRKAWETRKRGGSAAGRWNDYSVFARPNAPAWNSDHFKEAREAYNAYNDYIDQLNAKYPGPMGGQTYEPDELAKRNDLAQKSSETWFKATAGWKPRERVSFIRANNLERM